MMTLKRVCVLLLLLATVLYVIDPVLRLTAVVKLHFPAGNRPSTEPDQVPPRDRGTVRGDGRSAHSSVDMTKTRGPELYRETHVRSNK